MLQRERPPPTPEASALDDGRAGHARRRRRAGVAVRTLGLHDDARTLALAHPADRALEAWHEDTAAEQQQPRHAERAAVLKDRADALARARRDDGADDVERRSSARPRLPPTAFHYDLLAPRALDLRLTPHVPRLLLGAELVGGRKCGVGGVRWDHV